MHSPSVLVLFTAAAFMQAGAFEAPGGLAEAVVGLVRGCDGPGAVTCLQGRAVDALSANLDKDVSLGDFVVLSAPPADENRTSRTMRNKPTSDLLTMLSEFLASRTLQVRLPKQLIPKNLEEARGKLKKMGGTLLAGLMMMKGTLGALAFGALAMIAGKALLLSVMALTLALISALKKVSHGHSDHRRSGRRADDQDDGSEWVGAATVATDNKAAVAASAHYMAYRNQQPYQYKS
ncbi:uncharacterized protein LOC135946962 [Cloeon dipterum]|uniref:uncharacterized protein LOC135946962 n=1 Tax=Cloeon dipterum TaxID=197152 RepID=UPI003220425F